MYILLGRDGASRVYTIGSTWEFASRKARAMNPETGCPFGHSPYSLPPFASWPSRLAFERPFSLASPVRLSFASSLAARTAGAPSQNAPEETLQHRFPKNLRRFPSLHPLCSHTTSYMPPSPTPFRTAARDGVCAHIILHFFCFD